VWFEERSSLATKGFEPVNLTVSFRSTPAVLDAVDWVFSDPDTARGVAEADIVTHYASRKEAPGRVELWPLAMSDKADIDTADIEASRSVLKAPHERLARLIAVHAKSLVGKE